nr:zinc finger, CCHC-type [Tanacetum cinerariifolium]
MMKPRETKDEVSDQHSYCFNVEDDPKTFDEVMKSHDVAFRKKAINDAMDSIMGNNTWALTDLPLDQYHTARMYTIDKAKNHTTLFHTQHIGRKST